MASSQWLVWREYGLYTDTVYDLYNISNLCSLPLYQSILHVICTGLGPSYPSCLNAPTSHFALPCPTVLIVQPGARKHDEGLPYILARHGRGYQVDCGGNRAWAYSHLQLSIVRQECLKDLLSWIEITPTPLWLLDFGNKVAFRSSNTSSGVVCSRQGKGLKHGKGTCFLRPLNGKVKIQGEIFPCI